MSDRPTKYDYSEQRHELLEHLIHFTRVFATLAADCHYDSIEKVIADLRKAAVDVTSTTVNICDRISEEMAQEDDEFMASLGLEQPDIGGMR